MAILVGLAVASAGIVPSATGVDALPDRFANDRVINGLKEPDALKFSPDGRMFISERITGTLRVAVQSASSGDWNLLAQPFHTFDTPENASGQPEAVRSAGLRDIEFDPNFASNGFVYAFYMNNDTRQNRVVRIKTSSGNPNRSDSGFGEQVLIELPFNDTVASGSHNGGALEFGDDGLLYISTGDGFGGDTVQSLETLTGKILRITPSGGIPSSNPFFDETSGDFRSIYALGLRNPYSMSKHPETGKLYINEARGSAKASVYVVEARANYRHQQAGPPIGVLRSPWANSATGSAELITGGAWYPAGGPFPEQYHGSYFTAMWGNNGQDKGNITRIKSDSDTAVSIFEADIGIIIDGDRSNKPVQTQIGPDGALYYLLTTYDTSSGTVQRVSYTPQETVAAPTANPAGGVFDDAQTVVLATSTPGAIIRYTLGDATPTPSSPLYQSPLTISTSNRLNIRAFRAGFNPSSVVSLFFSIGASEPNPPTNQPPIVDAGRNRTVLVGTNVILDGSGSRDPDGSDDLLTNEQWTQLSGPTVEIVDASEEVASFVPQVTGVYRFKLELEDVAGATGSADVRFTVVTEADGIDRSTRTFALAERLG